MFETLELAWLCHLKQRHTYFGWLRLVSPKANPSSDLVFVVQPRVLSSLDVHSRTAYHYTNRAIALSCFQQCKEVGLFHSDFKMTLFLIMDRIKIPITYKKIQEDRFIELVKMD